MKKNIIITLLAAATLTSCGEYNKLLKSTDYEYKYEAAKNYFAKGQYNRSATLLNELITILKGTDKAEESLYMLGMSYYNQKDYQTAAQTFITYFNTYPRGTFTELARFHAGKALFLDTPEPRLDQSSTYQAIQQLQMFMEYFPNSTKKQEAQDMIFALQDKLVLKELYSARLYYNLGNYLGNNYESCVITAQNALKDYPYTDYREELSILVLRARHEMAIYTGNVYETVAIIGKRANQISVEIKNDLSKKLAEFASYNDNLEEVFENREQIEISRYYEKLPKPDLIATQEYIEGKIYYRNPAKEKEKLQ